MNKTTHDMNRFVKFTVYSLKFKEGGCRLHLGSRVARCLLLAVLLCAAVPAGAADYVLTYTSGNTIYYLARNGTTGVQRVTTFDPTTCIWSCSSNTAGTTASTLGTNNRYLFQVVNGTRYFLNYDLGFRATTANNNCRVRINNNLLYFYSNNRYIILSNATPTYSTTTTTGRARADQITSSTVPSTSTNPTINGADVLTATGNSTYTASGAAYRIGYTDYSFNGVHVYLDANGNTITPANATITNTWSLTDNAYATVNNSGVVTVTSLPEYDIVLTLTVTATATGGTPAAPANTTLTGTKEITIQGTKPAAPVISASGNTVTMSTSATGTTTIRYTLDGTTPTTSTGTVYSGAIDLSANGTSPVTITAITVRNGNASDVSTETVTLTLSAPTITANATAGTATISAAAGATIYYTTDGTTPTTSSAQYTTGLTGLSMMTIVKAIAVKDGWNNSPVASETLTIPSGVAGGVVTLFDYEDHHWSYYSDADCPIRSLNPADVKITYYGDGIVMTGNADYTASSSDYIQPGNANYVGGAKVNVGGEDENTFIYYKTLERGDATQTVWTFSSGNQSSAASRCPYTPIPNPFQVRPTYGSRGSTDANNFTGWRGFQCWRLKRVSGGSVYSAASGGSALSVGAVVNAETEIYFAPNSEYGMEVDFEAVWARAYLIKGNQGGANNILSQNVGVERNFMTLTSGQNYRFDGTSGRYIGNKGYAVTISCYYPSGEAPDNTNSTISGYDNMTLGADTKFENVTFNSMGSYTLTAANHSLIIGRGCSGTINYISGINGNVTSPNYTIRLESGTINYLSFLRGYSTGGDNSTDASGTVGGTPNIKGVLGCDYDRATNSGITNNLIINNGVFYGYSVGEGTGITYSDKSFTVYVKSGKIGNSFTINDSYTADAAQAFYIGIAGQRVRGHRILYMEGGEVASVAGGIDATANQNNNSVTFRMTGGHVRGAVYGGAARSAAYGNRNMTVTGGSITGWIGGGCNGEAYPAGQTSEDTYGGITNGASRVYFGGTAICGGTGSNVNINGSLGGIVFGAGKGVEGNTTSGRMAQGTTVVVADDCAIERNVYGGGNFGYAQTSTDVYVSGGTVQGSVFGGSNQNNGPVINIKMVGGLIEGGLYGGSNTTGTISANVTMQIDGGTVGNGDSGDGVFGGGYGSSTIVTGNLSLTLGASTSAADSATVNGNVFGGSALGSTNTGNATNTTTVTMNKALINGNLFGGALGNGAVVNGKITVNVNGGRVNGNIFGGGDAAAYSPSSNHPVVNMTGGQAINVFGGGKGATAIVTGNPQVVLSGNAKVTGNVYGGGDAAQVNGHTNVQLHD